VENQRYVSALPYSLVCVHISKHDSTHPKEPDRGEGQVTVLLFKTQEDCTVLVHTQATPWPVSVICSQREMAPTLKSGSLTHAEAESFMNFD